MTKTRTEKCGVWRMDGDRMVNMATGEELVDSGNDKDVEVNDDLTDLWNKLVTVLKGDNTV